jgi:hypothetical protein
MITFCMTHNFDKNAKAILYALLAEYHLIAERRFACPYDPESYAGGSIHSWLSHPCQTGRMVEVT